MTYCWAHRFNVGLPVVEALTPGSEGARAACARALELFSAEQRSMLLGELFEDTFRWRLSALETVVASRFPRRLNAADQRHAQGIGAALALMVLHGVSLRKLGTKIIATTNVTDKYSRVFACVRASLCAFLSYGACVGVARSCFLLWPCEPTRMARADPVERSCTVDARPGSSSRFFFIVSFVRFF